eukprot:CAMPEP_0113937018 /NCGR_PEP_ID=MMETSP1339-20121228/3728_1 /TAXON_ID=94617 /ORGANISM="Fibrocapsa japonica" /LENGTH=668 /DNA_ID=CAMNT_0000939625 /DNA_START=91 /DNA_END=2097 /DNA_ORIENTATION=+ /assembly_acc=CAM_ASM_000762
MRSWYLDNPSEHASAAILSELGVKIWEGTDAEEVEEVIRVAELELNASEYVLSPEDLGPTFEEHTADLSKEHKMDGDQVHRILDGSMFIDVRDSADEWVRVLLARSEIILIPPELYRRQLLTDQQYVKLEQYTSKSRPGTVRRSRQPEDKVAEEQLSHPYTRNLITDLCKEFYDLGWVTGTGGSISVRYGNRIYMTPSGVQKERMRPQDLFMLDLEGRVLAHPGIVPGTNRAYKLSACSPLFLECYKQRGAGAVLHSHGIDCVMATLLCEKSRSKEFQITHQEMIKGLIGYNYYDKLVIPVIENTAHEEDLADSLAAAIKKYPHTNAVLVQRHGIYVWGPTWMKAKTQAECLHYLFDVAVRMDKLDMNPGLAPPAWDQNESPVKPPPQKRPRPCTDDAPPSDPEDPCTAPVKVILLDIEGTTTPISFVRDVLFPFARDHARAFLGEHWGREDVQGDVRGLRDQAIQDLKDGLEGAVSIPEEAEDGSNREAVLDACMASIHWLMDSDRKVTPLKQLQGHIWKAGYHSGQLKGTVYPDVVRAFDRWVGDGVRVAIYSSGSRQAQQLLFGHTNAGDLRDHLSCYFDTTIGHKRQAESYKEIALSLGVTQPRDILFVTDILEEAQAADEAGLLTVLSVRPGNGELTSGHKFKIIKSFDLIKPNDFSHPHHRS